MAKRLEAPDREEIVIEGSGVDVTEVDAADRREVGDIDAEFGGGLNDTDYKLKVYRVIPNKGDGEWLFDCLPSELPIMERVRNEFNGGACFIRLYKREAGQPFNLIRKIPFTVAVPVNRPVKSSDLSDVLREMREQNAANFNQLKEVMMQSKGISAAPADQLTQMTAMLAVLKGMKDFVAPPQSNPLEMLNGVLSIVEKITPERGGGETGVWDVVKELAKSDALGQILQGVANRAQNPQLAAPGQVIQGAVVQPPIEGQSDMNAIQLAAIKAQIKMLVSKAQKGSDPGLYAELILDTVPENVVREQLLNSNSVDNLIQLVPEVAPHRAWFDALQSAIIELLTPDSEPDIKPDTGASQNSGVVE